MGGFNGLPNTVFDRVAEIADRLGVRPYTGEGPTVVLHTSDNTQYNLYELIAAFLDKVDGALDQYQPHQSDLAPPE